MYQQVLSRFGNFNAIQLSDPAPIKDLIILALKEEDIDSECNDDDTFKEKIAEVISLWLSSTSNFINNIYLLPL
jgi:DNA mismatch repair protein MLH1